MKQKIEAVAEKYAEMIWSNWCSRESIKSIIRQSLTELLSNAEGEVEEHPVTLDGMCPKCKAELQINGILRIPSQPTSKGERV